MKETCFHKDSSHTHPSTSVCLQCQASIGTITRRQSCATTTQPTAETLTASKRPSGLSSCLRPTSSRFNHQMMPVCLEKVSPFLQGQRPKKEGVKGQRLPFLATIPSLFQKTFPREERKERKEAPTSEAEEPRLFLPSESSSSPIKPLPLNPLNGRGMIWCFVEQLVL